MEEGGDGACRLENPEDTADDEDEEDDVRRFNHPPGNRAQEPFEALRTGVSVDGVLNDKAFSGHVFRNRLVGAGEQHGSFATPHLLCLAVELTRRNHEGQQAAEKDDARQQGEDMRDP